MDAGNLNKKCGMLVYRFLSLWLQNPKDSMTNGTVLKLIDKIPSWRFVDLMYQLAARLNKNTEFQTVLHKLLVKCGKDHPYHAVPVLMALANADMDTTITNNKTSNGSSKRNVSKTKENGSAMALRSEAAKQVLDQISMTSKSVKKFREDSEMLSQALIILAYTSVTESNGQSKRKLQTSEPICKIKRLQVPVLTHEIKVSKVAQYQDLPLLQEYEQGFTLVGGINAPKRIKCLGSDGKWRMQLIKGQDDLR